MRDRLTPRAQDRTAVPEKESEPARPAPDDLVRLQSTIGNRAVAAMIARWPFGGPVLAGPAAATHAKTSPAGEYSGILHREVDLLANAKAIVAFLRAKRGTSSRRRASGSLARRATGRSQSRSSTSSSGCARETRRGWRARTRATPGASSRSTSSSTSGRTSRASTGSTRPRRSSTTSTTPRWRTAGGARSSGAPSTTTTA
jgi:hypothetical protein